MSIWQAFGFVALGMGLAHLYNWMAWRSITKVSANTAAPGGVHESFPSEGPSPSLAG